MKKVTLLIAIGAFLLSAKSDAQHFITSFGLQHHWNVPQRIHHTIISDFYGYNWVHAKRVTSRGHVFFDVILQRGDIFIEVNVSSSGRILGRTYFEHYPLNNHVCGSYCGYHSNYYSSYYSACNSHHHHGHNHVVYRPNKYKHSSKYAYGHYKGHEYRKHESRHDRYRRDRYYDSHRDNRRSVSVSNSRKSRSAYDRSDRSSSRNDNSDSKRRRRSSVN